MSGKLRELRLAAAVEDQLSKDQILERYLNIAFFGGGGGSGGGAYGVEAAARLFFSTTPDKLTLAQAALLAGLVQAPTEYNPIDNPEKAIGRRNQVVTRMAEEGMVTEEEARQVRQSELGLNVSRLTTTCLPSWAPFFCDYVVHEIKAMPELGETPDERERNLMRGGLTIVTSLNRQAQEAAQQAMSDRIHPRDSAVGTMAMVEPGTGYIQAIANSREYGEQDGQTYINYAVDKKMGSAGGSNGIQAGSAFKPFVLAAAINQGMSLNTTIEAPQELDMSGEKFRCAPQTATLVYTTDRGLFAEELHRQWTVQPQDRNRTIGQHLLRPTPAEDRNLRASDDRPGIRHLQAGPG